MRVYLATSLPLLRQWLEAGETGAAAPAYAVTPSLREWYREADLDELEQAAQIAAAVGSLEVLSLDPAAPRRRVVLAVELAESEVTTESSRGRAVVSVSGPVAVSRWACALIDDLDATDAVATAVASLAGAARGEDDARFALDEVESHELGWHAVQELRYLFA